MSLFQSTDTDRTDTLRTAKYGFLIFLGVVAAVYHLWYVRSFFVEQNQHRVIHIGLMAIGAAVLAYDPGPETLRERLGNAIALVEAGLVAAATYYLFTNYDRMVYETIGIYTDLDMFVGALLIVLVLDITRRVYGPILSIVGLGGIVYALYGPYFPGILNHNGVSLNRVIQALSIEYSEGLFGVITGVSATYIVIFLILAGMLEAYGALDYFIQIGTLVGRRIKSGLAQMTTITSLGMGSVNGSAAANAATTGAFTIPLLKRHGMDKETAASFEAVASSGGQIMPPIMGAAAFVMAQITGTRYLTIIAVGLLPALLFYLSVAIGVHLTTLKVGLSESEIDIDEIEAEDTTQERTDALERLFGRSPSTVSFGAITARNLLVEGLALWVPVGVLIYTLVILLFDPLYAGFWSIASVFPAAFVQNVVLGDDYDLRDFGVDTLDGLGRGLENAAPIGVAIGVMNVFVGVLSLTGFTQVFANSLIGLSGGVAWLLLFFAMIAALLFGLGMPTVAAYITAVLLIAPALVELGIPILSAHFFVFYFAILSALTPPVAIACLVASNVSGGNFWVTSWKSIILAAPLFILPYVFVVNDSLLYWELPATIIAFVSVAIAFAGVAAALINYLDGPIALPVRILLLVGSVLIMFAPLAPQSLVVRSVAVAVVLATLAWQSNAISIGEQGLFSRDAR
ncbi:TRAP transporter permease [Halalkalirubrum salinum]|uniref:TRAP transporter permease n=1 Tax=Halalkalirubrum salinum TaxID=2563889 RepID=UPI0010FB39AB|nr:TRAP transporter fused permease subunit [Halalkalirubrum salinum]